jgi:hypothetical protein
MDAAVSPQINAVERDGSAIDSRLLHLLGRPNDRND